jgi:biopolymer transport protein ExbD
MEIPSSRSQRRARIEIVPLIDIMFFLLATFVMVSLSMVKSRGIAVVLPQASTGQPQEQSDHVSVSVTENGQLYLDKRELSQAELVETLARLKAQNPELRVHINGDQNARLGLAISVLDEVRKLGISKISFETRPASGR